MCKDDDCELELEDICEHENITEEGFIKSMTCNLEGIVIISVPHTVRFTCRDCLAHIDMFVVDGAFNF